MKFVIFPYEANENGGIVYPDDISKFGRTEVFKGPPKQVWGEYFGDLALTEVDPSTINPEPVRKTVYDKARFISLIPDAKIREIQQAAETDDRVNAWVFRLQNHVGDIDLNDLPSWFTDGLAAMVDTGIFTQEVINAFLEI